MEKVTGVLAPGRLAAALATVLETRGGAVDTRRTEPTGHGVHTRGEEPCGAVVQELRAELALMAECNARLEERNGALEERIGRLEHLLRELRGAVYGKKSEKLPHDQRQLAFEELEGALGEFEQGEPPSPTRTPRTKPRDGRRNLGDLPAHLPRVERVIEPPSTQCPCGCGEMVRIGEDRTERLDIVPAQFRVLVTVRPKYACRVCERGVIQAPAPAHLIEGALPSEGALAHVLVSKYADHLPLYRQVQIFARSGVDLDRSTLARWVGKTAFHLRPLVECLAAQLKKSNKLFMDETTIAVLDPGRGRTKRGYLWTMARDDRAWRGPDPPGVVYTYAPGRGGHHGEKVLEGFAGTLQTDGYSGYRRLTRPDRPHGALTLAHCWAHVRRALKDVADAGNSPIAQAGLRRIARLYEVEKRIRGQSPATRQAVRWDESAPLVNQFGFWLDEQRSRVSPRSRLGEKLTYIANHWQGLLVFLYDGRVELDSNPVENLMRPVKLNAKNSLFAGHDEGAHAWARIASLIETCKLNGVDPYAWLKATLEKIAAGHPNSKVHELLPWAFPRASS